MFAGPPGLAMAGFALLSKGVKRVEPSAPEVEPVLTVSDIKRRRAAGRTRAFPAGSTTCFGCNWWHCSRDGYTEEDKVQRLAAHYRLHHADRAPSLVELCGRALVRPAVNDDPALVPMRACAQAVCRDCKNLGAVFPKAHMAAHAREAHSRVISAPTSNPAPAPTPASAPSPAPAPPPQAVSGAPGKRDLQPVSLMSLVSAARGGRANVAEVCALATRAPVSPTAACCCCAADHAHGGGSQGGASGKRPRRGGVRPVALRVAAFRHTSEHQQRQAQAAGAAAVDVLNTGR
jgi:hypothetical protein